MKLEELHITLGRSYEANAGRYKCEVKYECDNNKVTLVLDPELSQNILGYLGPVITEYSRRTSLQLEANIKQALLEASKLPVLELK